ncbi:hypothetical protein [Reinekea sp. G2M2-21]|uniref:hypothetical protein n=1 Tax=Reinekea sp. G2M2-21 TaxID=2788942 RepID=UPI0018AB6BEA|nr:hypothetical protein [Reinekea sp. G2M2-21]
MRTDKKVFESTATINHASFGADCPNARRFRTASGYDLMYALRHSARTQIRLFEESGTTIQEYQRLFVRITHKDETGSIVDILEQEWSVPLIADTFMPDLEALRTVLTYDSEWEVESQISDDDRKDFAEYCESITNEHETFEPYFQTRIVEVAAYTRT